jgi:autotransporter translocation and assembly factor TamB
MDATVTPRRPRPTRLRRLLGALALALAVLLALLFLLHATRALFLGPWLSKRLARELAQRSGAQIEIGSVGGNWWSDVELRDLRWTNAAPDAPIARLEVAFARAEFGLRALLGGGLDGLEALELHGVDFELRNVEGSGAAPATWTVPARLPRITLRDVSALIALGPARLELQGANLDLVDHDGAAQAGSLSAQHCSFRLEEGREDSSPIALEFRWAAPRLEVASLRLGEVERLRDAWLDLAHVARGDLAWAGELDALGGRLVHDASLEKGRLDVQVALRDVQLKHVLDYFWPARGMPAAILDGSGTFGMDLARPAEMTASYAGRLTDVRWAGRVVESMEGEATYGERTLAVARLDARSGRNRVSVRDLTLPLGVGGAETLRAARGNLDVELSNLPALLEGVADTGQVGRSVPAHDLQLVMRLDEQGMLFERGSLKTADGSLQVRPSRLIWGTPSLADTWMDIDLELDFGELASLGAILSPSRVWAGSLRGVLDVHGTWTSLVGHIEAQGSDVIAAGLALGEVRAKADIDTEQVRVAEFFSDGAFGKVDGSGTWELAQSNLRDVRLDVQGVDVAALLPASFSAGELTFKGRLSGALHDPRGEFEFQAEGLQGKFARGLLLERVSASGRLEDAQWVFDSFEAHSSGAQMLASGAVTHVDFGLPFDVRLDELTLRRDDLDLKLVGGASLRVEKDLFEARDVQLTGSAGDLHASVVLQSGDLHARVRGSNLDPLPLLAPLLPAGFELAGVSCNFEFERRAGVVGFLGVLSIEKLRLAAGLPGAQILLRGRLADGQAALEEFSIDAGEGRRLDITGSAPFDPGADEPLGPGAVALQGGVKLRALQELPWHLLGWALPLAGDLEADVNLSGSWDELGGSLLLDGFDLALVSPRSGAELFGPAGLHGRLQFGPDGVRLHELDFRAPGQAAITGHAELSAALQPARWEREGFESLLSAPLAARLKLEVSDLAVVSRFLPEVRRLGGVVAGEVGLAGSLGAPELSGSLSLSAGELRLAADLPPLHALEARIDLFGDHLEIAELRGDVGGGPIVSKARLDWGGERPVLDLQVEGEHVLIVQQPTLRLRSDVSLSVRGPLDELVATGSLGLRDGRYTRKIEFYAQQNQVRSAPPTEFSLFSIASGPLSTMRFNIDIRSLDSIVVRNNLLDGALRCDLRLGGTGRMPDLVGTVFVDPTLVRLPASVLETTAGTIVFDYDDPLVARLDVRMTTRVRGYDVALHLTGTSLEPELELTSSPPLTEEALLMLVLTGKPPESEWGAAGTNEAMQNVAVFIGKDLLQGWFGGTYEGESLLDRIEWRSGVDVTQTGGETSEVSIRLRGTRSGTGRAIWLRAEQDVYDRNNLGLRFVFRRK